MLATERLLEIEEAFGEKAQSMLDGEKTCSHHLKLAWKR